MLEQVVIGAYTAVNSLRVFSYLPQIAKVTRARDRAEAISLLTWTLWTFSNVTTSVYGALIVRDALLMTIFAANAVCCVAVIAIVVWKRKRHDEEALCLVTGQEHFRSGSGRRARLATISDPRAFEGYERALHGASTGSSARP